jgi:tetratricopeptide (TPR) repeat protein
MLRVMDSASVLSNQAVEADPLELPLRLLAEGRPAEAMMQVELALARSPGDPRALALREEIAVAIASMDPQLARLELTAVLSPESADAQFELGHGYLSFGRPQDAERCFERALELRPHSAELHACLAAVHLAAGRIAPAERHSLRALDLEPGHAVASQTLAAVLEGRGEAKAAEALLDQAYRRCALFQEPSPAPRLCVLVLASAGAGNTPYRRIMPPASYSRLVWYMEYARAEEEPPPDRYDLVFNAIGDADFAEPCQPGLERFLARCPRPVLNPPERVALTRRDRIPALLGALPDVVVPRTVRLKSIEIELLGLEELVRRRGFEGPVLTRPIGSHGGQGLSLAEDQEGLCAQRLAPGLDHYLTGFCDYRSADGLYRKYRVLFVDREPFPYHLAVSDHWLVHHDTAGMTGSEERQAEEANFLEHPETAIGSSGMAAVCAIGRALDLDYCGVDFSLLPDGRVLVFEANAAMLAHDEDPAGPFAYKNPYVARIAEAFQGLMARAARA